MTTELKTEEKLNGEQLSEDTKYVTLSLTIGVILIVIITAVLIVSML
jgi:hypothetical protein